MKIAINSFFLAMSIVIINGCVSKQENNWPQFRGTNSLGIAPESATPPVELNPEKNLAWKIHIAAGLSSPCIFAGRIFLSGFNPKDSALITYCIDQRKGSLLWEREVFPDTLEKVHSIGSPASPTPATDGSAVYVYFGAYGVICYDPAGKILWERRLPILNAQYGSNGSPIVHDSLLIVNRVEFTKPSIIALNKHNGKTVWESHLDNVILASEPLNISQSTPVIWRDQVIIHRAFEIVSLSLNDGKVKWSAVMVSTGNATPIIINDTLYVNGWFNLGNSELFDSIPDFYKVVRKYDVNHDKLINISEIPSTMAFFKRPELKIPTRDTLTSVKRMASGFDSNGDFALGKEEWEQMQKMQLSYLKQHGVIALNLTGETDKPVLIWTERDFVPEVPSMTGIESGLYMILDGGNVVCLNSRTGKIIFRGRLGAPGAYLSSPLYANGHIYFASYNGKITIIKPGNKLNIIARIDLHERIAASPVAMDNMLYIRTDSALYAFKK
jgi:outer membrane protein assembly factor BamB